MPKPKEKDKDFYYNEDLDEIFRDLERSQRPTSKSSLKKKKGPTKEKRISNNCSTSWKGCNLSLTFKSNCQTKMGNGKSYNRCSKKISLCL